jgi:hypothetical protein
MAVDRKLLDQLLACGAQAPSGDNLQPWIVDVDGDEIRLLVDTSRDQSLYNFEYRASLIALGAMIENITIAGRHLGVAVQTSVARTPNGLAEARLSLADAQPRYDPLFDSIGRRCTNRKPYQTRALPAATVAALEACAPKGCGGDVRVVQDRQTMRIVAKAASLNDRLLFEVRPLHDTFYQSMRWTEAEAEASRDGLFVKTLELGPIELSFKASRSWAVVRTTNLLGASRLAPFHSLRTFMKSAAFAFVQMDSTRPEACVAGGQLAERTWLTATSLGLGVQPMAGMLCLLPYLRSAGSSGISAGAREVIARADSLFRQALPLGSERLPILLLRMGAAPPPTATSLRRELRESAGVRRGIDQ